MNNLRERLDKMGLKRVGLKGQKVIGSQDSLVEGQFDPMSEEKAITLALGVYDPSLSDADYTNSVAEVMNHEAVHALVDMNVFTPKEINLLKKAAKKTKFVNTDGKKRSYSYLDRAGRLNGDLVGQKGDKGRLSAVEEEAIAEMYRDYSAGRLKNVGTSRPLFKRIGDFFRSIVGAHVDNGFNNVGSIFSGIGAGSVADRAPVTTVTQTPTSRTEVTTAKQSAIPIDAVVEEDSVAPENIRMPINTNAPNDQIRAEIEKLTKENVPLVKRLIKRIDEKFGTKSGDNIKDLSKVTQKASRPSILANKPWHDASHIRDSYRFKTVIDDFRDVPAIFDELLKEGISLVKIDTNKLFEPKEWGWRIIAFDIRMPNGQLVEWYLPLRELEVEKKARGHLIFEEWRNKTQQELQDQQAEYFASIAKSYRNYDAAFQAALDRTGISRQEAESSWRSAESSMLEAARNARRSSAVGISSPTRVPTGLTDPSSVRTDDVPSGLNITAREVPSSTRAKASSAIDITPSTETSIISDQIESTFGDIDTEALGIKTSKVPLTPAQRDASILDYLNPKTGQPQFKKKEGSETLVSFAEKLLGLRNVAPLDIINSERDKQDAARIMAAEAEAALISGSDALGWYDSTLKLAKRVLFPVYPEVSPERPDGSPNSEYDPAAEHAFDFATAITSNGLSVIDNYRFASEQYDAWKASDNGTFPVKGSGAQGGSMLSAFEFWNTLSRKGMSSGDIDNLLNMQLPRKELNRLMADTLGVEKIKDLPKGFKSSGAELGDTMVAVAYILGPKIGNGFYQNLRGNYDPLTMDRWWMRFANRITGNPTVKYADELVEQNLDKVWNFITEADKPLTDMDRNILFEAQRKLNISTMDKTDIPLVVDEIGTIWNRDYYTKAYNDKVEELLTSGQYEFTLNDSKTPEGRDAATVKSLAADARPSKTDFLRASETYQKKLIPALQEDPRNAQDRAAMREVANRARQILKDEAGVDITNADFQSPYVVC